MNRNQNIKNPLGQLSPFYSVSPKQTDSLISVPAFSADTFCDFLISFDRLYITNKNSSGFSKTLVELIIHFCFLHNSIDSRFLKFICSNTRYIRIPTYLHLLLLKVAISVESKNKSTGWTNGNVRANFSLLESLNLFKSLLVDRNEKDHSELDIFLNTPFAEVKNNPKFRLSFKALLSDVLNEKIETLAKAESLSDQYEMMLDHFSTFSEIVYKGDFPEFKGYINYDVSPNLGMFRFRNSDYIDIFYVSQLTCQNISLETLNLFAVSLKLFRPRFYQGSDNICTTSFLPGDAELSVEDLSYRDAWEKLLSYAVITPNPHNGRNRSNSLETRYSDNDTRILSRESGIPVISDETDFLSSNDNVLSVSPCGNYAYVYRSTVRHTVSYFKIDSSYVDDVWLTYG